MNGEQMVLAFPREDALGTETFAPWPLAGEILTRMAARMRWTPREEAETADDLVQLIPCTTVTDHTGRHHVFQRVERGRSDLRGRASLLIGGHIDLESNGGSRLDLLIAWTLFRETMEELEAARPDRVTKVGLIADPHGPDQGRHLAVAHESAFTGPLRPRPGDEFEKQSSWEDRAGLERLADGMDPWSKILLARHILPAGFRSRPETEEMDPPDT